MTFWMERVYCRFSTIKCTTLVTMIVSVAAVANLGAAQIYWSDSSLGKMRRANLDGSHVADFLPAMGAASDIVFNASDGLVYWSTAGPSSSIYRSAPDGSAVQRLFTRTSETIKSFAIDAQNGKIYRAAQQDPRIFRSNLDGTANEFFVSGREWVEDIAIDSGERILFWSDTANLARAPLDSPGWFVIATNTVGAGVALDPLTRSFFAASNERINVQYYDELNSEPFLDPVFRTYPINLAIDDTARRIYWTEAEIDSRPFPAFPSRIRRANLDGTQVETILTGIRPSTIAIVPEPPSIALALIASIFGLLLWLLRSPSLAA